MKTKQECQNCLYSLFYFINETEELEDEGVCHRYPPNGTGKDAMFPTVYKDDWCGEWKPEEPEEPEEPEPQVPRPKYDSTVPSPLRY